MALPFIAGAILGGLAVAAFNNKDKIKSTLESGLDKGKEFAENAKEFAEKKIGDGRSTECKNSKVFKICQPKTGEQVRKGYHSAEHPRSTSPCRTAAKSRIQWYERYNAEKSRPEMQVFIRYP